MRSREEHRHTDVDEQAALDLLEHGAGDDIALGVRRNDALPSADSVGALLREVQQPGIFVGALHEHFKRVADFRQFVIFEFVSIDDAFGFVADVDRQLVLADADHAALHDAFGLELAEPPDRFLEERDAADALGEERVDCASEFVRRDRELLHDRFDRFGHETTAIVAAGQGVDVLGGESRIVHPTVDALSHASAPETKSKPGNPPGRAQSLAGAFALSTRRALWVSDVGFLVSGPGYLGRQRQREVLPRLAPWPE